MNNDARGPPTAELIPNNIRIQLPTNTNSWDWALSAAWARQMEYRVITIPPQSSASTNNNCVCCENSTINTETIAPISEENSSTIRRSTLSEIRPSGS